MVETGLSSTCNPNELEQSANSERISRHEGFRFSSLLRVEAIKATARRGAGIVEEAPGRVQQ